MKDLFVSPIMMITAKLKIKIRFERKTQNSFSFEKFIWNYFKWKGD